MKFKDLEVGDKFIKKPCDDNTQSSEECCLLVRMFPPHENCALQLDMASIVTVFPEEKVIKVID